MRETSKAVERRLQDDALDWKNIIKGKVLDIGAGDDPLTWPHAKVTPFDKENGDANFAKNLGGPWDCVHASQCLEHMVDPYLAIHEWAACVKKGGHLVVSVPDFELYEHLRFPSVWNPDHKSTWSMHRKGTRAGRNHVQVLGDRWRETCRAARLETIRFRLVDTNYDYNNTATDQTFKFENKVEAFIEMVFEKL